MPEAAIRFLATVQLRDAGGKERTLPIVGYDEIDPARHWISIDAPVARALLGKHPGDRVALPGPEGPEHWTVEAFTYDEP